jgi:Zn-dependent peptidase ImmA (M78 family)
MADNYTSALDGELFAGDLLKQLKINGFPIDIDGVINELGIQCLEKDMGNSEFGGFLQQEGDDYYIILNSNYLYETRRRFTIAHELGHYWIPTHQGNSYECMSKNINSYLAKDKKEIEANTFASEFLMPKSVFLKDIGKISPSIKSILSLSDKYGTSLTATALKFVKLTQEPCVIILSENMDIKWEWKSKSFKYELLSKLHKDTNAYEMFSTKQAMIRDTIYSDYWVLNSKDDYICEDSFYFNGLNQVLTILIPVGLANDSNDDEYDDTDY